MGGTAVNHKNQLLEHIGLVFSFRISQAIVFAEDFQFN